MRTEARRESYGIKDMGAVKGYGKDSRKPYIHCE